MRLMKEATGYQPKVTRHDIKEIKSGKMEGMFDDWVQCMEN